MPNRSSGRKGLGLASASASAWHGRVAQGHGCPRPRHECHGRETQEGRGDTGPGCSPVPTAGAGNGAAPASSSSWKEFSTWESEQKRLSEGKMSARRSTFPQIPTLLPATHSLRALLACHPSSPRYLGYLRLPTRGDSGEGGGEGRRHPAPLSRPLLLARSRVCPMAQLWTFLHAPGHPGVHWGTYGKTGAEVPLPRGPGTAQS